MTTRAEGLIVVGVIQARMDSRRLPGKVLADICGEPMLARIHERLSYAKSLSRIVVATTTDPTDDVLVAECERRGWDYVRGPVDKLAVRLFLAGGTFGADAIVRVWGDCPCVDPELVDEVVDAFGCGPTVTTFAGPCYGLGVEVYALNVLGRMPANVEACQFYPAGHWSDTHEHVPPGLLPTYDLSLTVDYPDDLERTRRIYEALYNPARPFGWREVLALPEEILNIGQHHPRNTEYLEGA